MAVLSFRYGLLRYLDCEAFADECKCFSQSPNQFMTWKNRIDEISLIFVALPKQNIFNGKRSIAFFILKAN